jgi:riboflavin kinase/FMN adenylyltransferase
MEYKISGLVVKGDSYGRKLGFPTINLETHTEATPPYGVYAGYAVLDDTEYRAGILINPNGKVEAHLLSYSGDAYGKRVTLQLKEFLREFKKFNTEDELKKQIGEDLKKC